MSETTVTRKTPHKKQVIASRLRDIIRSLQPGDRLPSVTEMERLFGVANSTVEAALSDLTAEGMIVRRQGSGTFVADHHRHVQDSRDAPAGDLVALLAYDRNNPYTGALIQRLEAELRAIGKAPVLLFNDQVKRSVEMAYERWKNTQVLGFIHIGSVDLGDTFGMPGVVLGETPQSGRVNQVVVDNFGAGRRVGEYLWNLGHRSVAFVHATQSALASAPRLAGLRRAWDEHNAPGEDAHEVCLPFYANIADEYSGEFLPWIEPLFGRTTPPTAIFAADDYIAVQIIRTLERMGKRVPDDVSIVGFNDIGLLAAHVRPALTTVRMPARVLCALAVQVLIEQVGQSNLPSRTLRVPGELIVRESVRPVGNVSDRISASARIGQE